MKDGGCNVTLYERGLPKFMQQGGEPILPPLLVRPNFFSLFLLQYINKMGRIRHEFTTPKKARFFGLLERGMSRPAAAKELNLDRITAWRWTKAKSAEPERCTRLLSSRKLGRPRVVTDEHIN